MNKRNKQKEKLHNEVTLTNKDEPLKWHSKLVHKIENIQVHQLKEENIVQIPNKNKTYNDIYKESQ